MDRKRLYGETLEAREARFSYLVALGDVIRPLADPQRVKAVASRLLGERLNVSRVVYGEIGADGSILVERTPIDGREHADPLPHLDDYDPAMFVALREGRTLAVEDVEAEAAAVPRDRLAVFAAAGCRAYAAAPILKDGLLVGALSLVQSTPRRWTALDVGLLEETASRTWEAIERARAERRLRASERKLARILRHVPVGVGLFDRSGRFTLVNERLSAFVGDVIPAREHGAAERWIAAAADGARLAPEDFPGARALKGEDTPDGVRFQHRAVDGSTRWLRMAAMSARDEEDGADGGVMVLQDVDLEVQAELGLAQSEARLRSLMEGLPQLIWRADGDGRWVWSSPQWRAFTGQRALERLGDGWIEAVHPDDREATRGAWRDALAEGSLHVEHRLRDAAANGWRWHQTRAAAIRDERGKVREWMGACTDIHDLRCLQERQRSLVSELQHRTRNLMAVVQAIGAASAEGPASVDDYQRRFNRRLAALGRAQTLLASRLEGEPVTLGALVRSELADVDGPPRVTLSGPDDLAVRSREVQVLTLALHELAANAAEHGALARPEGRLSVVWRRSPDAADRFELAWRETGGPPQPGAPKRGFGREVIEHALSFQANAQVDYAFEPGGLTCTIAMALRPTEPG